MKKIMSAFLAMAMCAALAVPVLAAAPNRDTAYSITLQDPTIDVEVPEASAVKLNPYQIKVTDGSIGATNAQGSILAAEMYLVNKSNVPLKMSVTVTGSVPATSKATFASSAPDASEKNKKVFLFVDVGAVTEGTKPAATLSNVTYSPTNTKQCVVKAGDVKLTDVLDISVPTGTSNYVTISVGGACASTPTEAWAQTDVVGLTMTFSFQATNNTVSGS